MPLTSAPTGFEPALTAPEGVASSGADQRKRAHGRPFWTRIGHGADSRRSRPCRSPMVFHMPRSDHRVSLALHPGIPAPATAGMACKEDARAGDPGPAGCWAAAGGWRRFSVVGFADPGGEDRKPVPAARGWVGVMVPGVVAGGGGHGEGMREACGGHAAIGRAPREATWDRRRQWAGPVLLRGRHCACAGGRVRCHQGPHGVSGAFAGVFRARDSPRHSSSYHLTTLTTPAAGIGSMCVRGGVGGKGIGYPIGAG